MASGLTLVPRVAFELSEAEATAPSAVRVELRQLLLGVFGANIVLNLINAVLETFVRPGHADPILASVHLLTAALFAGAIFANRRRAKPRKQRAWAVSFNDAGMQLAVDAGPPRAIPWRAIRRATDTGTVMVLQYGTWRSAIIPRRAYADERGLRFGCSYSSNSSHRGRFAAGRTRASSSTPRRDSGSGMHLQTGAARRTARVKSPGRKSAGGTFQPTG